MRQVRQGLVVMVAVGLPALAFVRDANGVTPVDIRTRETSMSRARTTWDSVYTIEQASRGETTYTKTCARCHQASLGGADEAPALTGSAFMGSWNGQTLQSLHDRIRTTMPTDTPGTYSRQQIADVMAYMLKFNQFPAGKTELPVGDEELKGILFVSLKP